MAQAFINDVVLPVSLFIARSQWTQVTQNYSSDVLIHHPRHCPSSELRIVSASLVLMIQAKQGPLWVFLSATKQRRRRRRRRRGRRSSGSRVIRIVEMTALVSQTLSKLLLTNLGGADLTFKLCFPDPKKCSSSLTLLKQRKSFF